MNISKVELKKSILLYFPTIKNVIKYLFKLLSPLIQIIFFFPQLLEYDKELSVFKDRLHELEIAFPPRYGAILHHTHTSLRSSAAV